MDEEPTSRRQSETSHWENVDIDEEYLPTETTKKTGSKLSIPNKLNPDYPITISEPVKQGEGMNAYISYKIHTTTDREGYRSTSFSVIRRYSDFLRLHAILSLEYPGIIVPPVPEKLLVGRFSPEFIESRRRALEIFLNRAFLHSDLRHSQALKQFLENVEEDFSTSSGPSSSGTTKPSDNSGSSSSYLRSTTGSSSSSVVSAVLEHPASTGIMQWIDETVQQISTSLGSAPAFEITETDRVFEQLVAYIDGLEPLILSLYKHATGLTKRGREIAEGLHQFGLSLEALGKTEEASEGNAGLIHGALSQVGACAGELSTLSAEQTQKEVLYLEEPILDYIRLISAVKVAFQKRMDAKLTYETAWSDLVSKQVTLDKLLATLESEPEMVEKGRADVRRAQERVDDVKLEFDLITERVCRELERFKLEKAQDFKAMILDYIHVQIEYNRQVEQEWSQIIQPLQALQEQHLA